MTAFATIAQLSAYLRFSIDPSDPFAQLALDAATQAIRKYTNQHLSYVADETVTLDGSGSDTMLLPEVPVTNVSQVIVDVDLDTPKILLDNSHGSMSEYDFVNEAGLLVRRRGQYILYQSNTAAMWGMWPERRKSVQVTYSHGYRAGTTTEAITTDGGLPDIHLDVQGYNSATCSLLYVIDQNDNTILDAVEDGDGIIVSTTDTTGHVLLVVFTRTETDFPADINMICVTAAARAISQDGGSIEATGSYNVTYAGQPGSLTADEKRVLDRYRSRKK